MGKVLARLLILILIGLSGYLYVRVVNLQKENADLSAQIAAASVRGPRNLEVQRELEGTDNYPKSAENGQNNPVDWVNISREHVHLAEEAVAKGNFADAVKQTKFANLALTRATDEASSSSRQTVDSLRTQLQATEKKAQSLWSDFDKQ